MGMAVSDRASSRKQNRNVSTPQIPYIYPAFGITGGMNASSPAARPLTPKKSAYCSPMASTKEAPYKSDVGSQVRED